MRHGWWIRSLIVQTRQWIRDALIALQAARKARDQAAPGTEVEYGARHIEAREEHRRAEHRASRMRQMARIIKEQYAEKFRYPEE